MRRTLALIGLLAAALAGGVAVSGCGGASGLDTSAVAQAAQTTQNAGTAQLSFTAEAAGQTFHGGGFMDMKGRAAELSLTMAQLGTIREIYAGSKLYMQLPPSLRKGPLAGKPWAGVDIAAVARSQGVDLGALQSLGDPSRTLDQLRALGDVKKVGTDTVRGVETTHFSAVVDLRKAADRAPAAMRADVRRSIDAMVKRLGQSKLPVDVWLDAQKRVRREQITMNLAGQQVKMTFDLFNFGVAHRVTPPPADQVTDLTKLVARQSSQGQGLATP